MPLIDILCRSNLRCQIDSSSFRILCPVNSNMKSFDTRSIFFRTTLFTCFIQRGCHNLFYPLYFVMGYHEYKIISESLNSCKMKATIPISMKANGVYFECCPLFKTTNCDLKKFCSFLVSSNVKSLGKRSIFLRTACFKTRVSKPYISADHGRASLELPAK